MNLLDECYVKAEEVLLRNVTKFGFKASFKYYNSVWARDGVIACLGANLTDNEKLVEASKRTIESLGKLQSETGQIPNVLILNEEGTRVEKVSWYAVDAVAWWIIGVWNHFFTTQDENFLREMWPKLKKAYFWLRCQQNDDSALLSSCEAADWMDSSIARRGKVLYNNCLWFKAVECINQLAKILGETEVYNHERIKEMINVFFWPTERSINMVADSGFVWRTDWYEESIHPEREHYTNFISFEWYEGRCDVLANVLTIIFNIADKEKKKKIIEYFYKKRLSNPYPIKVLNPPVWVSSYAWNPKIDVYRPNQVHNIPFQYHNAGIWPYVGGFYVLALTKSNEKKKAKTELKKLAEANKVGKEIEWEFNEWLHGKTGKPMGAVLQSWSAAGYLIAYKAVMEGEIVF